jgi:hypothetical protein
MNRELDDLATDYADCSCAQQVDAGIFRPLTSPIHSDAYHFTHSRLLGLKWFLVGNLTGGNSRAITALWNGYSVATASLCETDIRNAEPLG